MTELLANPKSTAPFLKSRDRIVLATGWDCRDFDLLIEPCKIFLSILGYAYNFHIYRSGESMLTFREICGDLDMGDEGPDWR